MTNGDMIRSMGDLELAEFMRLCEREEIRFYQNDCSKCINRPCEECRIAWLGKEIDKTMNIICKTLQFLFPEAEVNQHLAIALKIYEKVKETE